MARIWQGEVDRVELGEGDWADIKPRMTYGDQQKVTGHYIKLQSRLSKGSADADLSVELESGQLALLEANVLAWSLTGKDGQPLPVTKENLRALWPDVAKSLLDEIGKRNPNYPFAKIG